MFDFKQRNGSAVTSKILLFKCETLISPVSQERSVPASFLLKLLSKLKQRISMGCSFSTPASIARQRIAIALEITNASNRVIAHVDRRLVRIERRLERIENALLNQGIELGPIENDDNDDHGNDPIILDAEVIAERILDAAHGFGHPVVPALPIIPNGDVRRGILADEREIAPFRAIVQEEASQIDGKNVRFDIDKNDLPFCRGFVMFPTAEDQMCIDINIHKSASYKLLICYSNPTEFGIELGIKFVLLTADFDQSAKVVLPPSGAEPRIEFVQSKPEQPPFVLNPGRWQLQLTAQKRLFLDYVVLIPTEYYQGSHLTECRFGQTHNCVELRYPPAPFKSTIQTETAIQKFEELAPGSTERVNAILSISPDTLLPKSVGLGSLVHTEDQSEDIRVEISVPEDGIYLLAVDYHSQEPNTVPIRVHVEQTPKQQPAEEEGVEKETKKASAEKSLLVPAASTTTCGDGQLLINHCYYDFFCRELVSSADGRPTMMQLRKSPPDAIVTLSVQPSQQFSLRAISLVKEEEWKKDLLQECLSSVPTTSKNAGGSGETENSNTTDDNLSFPLKATFRGYLN